MTEEMETSLREWLRENLVIDVDSCDKWGPGNDVYVGLRLKGDRLAFSTERVSIPSREDA